MTSGSLLLAPFRLGDLELPNRVVMAPMTRNRAGPGNVPTPLMATYYAQRASAGLIVSEGTQVSPRGQGYPGTPGIHDAAQVAGWREVTAAVHAAGGRIFAQLWHVGRISHPALLAGALPVAPSAIRPAGEAMTCEGPKPFVTPHALSAEEIEGIIAEFRQAAVNAREAGFDGVELHGANGYLIDQFLRDATNHRDDEWGGSIDNRLRLLVRVTEALIEAWPRHRVGVRISPENRFNDIRDSDPQALFETVAARLGELGIGYLHVLEGDMTRPDAPPEVDYRVLRERFGGVYMANNGYDRERAEAAIASGAADLVSFGRLFLANPDLPRRFAIGAPLNEPDPETFYVGGERGYIDYPTLEEAGAA